MNQDLRDSELYESRFKIKERRSNARFFTLLFALFICFFAFRGWWASAYGGVIVDGNSMRKTLTDGEQLLMRYTDKKHKAQRGDIIVVYVGGYAECADVNGDFLIKRLIAIEGDKVRCTDGQIEIDYAGGGEEWVKLDEPYAYYGIGDAYKSSYDFNCVYEVKAGEIFFLGDNRSGKGSSVDSRYHDFPNGSHLQGRLYKESDIYGVVPAWALEHRSILAKIFF